MLEYFGRVDSAFEAPCTFWTGRRNMLLYFNVIFTRRAHFRCVQNDIELYSSIFLRSVEDVQDASPKYATIFRCYFGRVMQVSDASKMTFKTPPPE